MRRRFAWFLLLSSAFACQLIDPISALTGGEASSSDDAASGDAGALADGSRDADASASSDDSGFDCTKIDATLCDDFNRDA